MKTEPTKELRIEARLKNNVLWHAIFDIWPSVAAFCREKNFNQSEISGLLNLRKSPLRKSGSYTPICEKLAEVLGFSCEELFPLKIYQIKRTKGVIEVGAEKLLEAEEKMLALPSTSNPFNEVLEGELASQVEECLDSLRQIEAEVIRMRYGIGKHKGHEHTLGEVAQVLGLTKERVRQLESQAIRKLRAPRIREYDEQTRQVEDLGPGPSQKLEDFIRP